MGEMRDISRAITAPLSIEELLIASKMYEDKEWKYYNTRYINLNIDYPKQLSVIVSRSMLVDDKLKVAVSVIVANLLGLKETFSLAYPRNTGRGQSTLPRQYNKRKISTKKIVEAADWLVREGYAEEQRGKSNVVAELRTSSKLWPTKKLISLFSQETINYLDVSYILNNNPVVLKNSCKQEIDYRDNDFTRETKNAMSIINACNNKHIFKDAKGNVLNCSSLTRIFTEEWSYGGRLYRTDAQQIKQKDVPKELTRLGITIDHSPVVEVDYCNLHAMLLCAMEGIHPDKFSGDFYSALLQGCENILPQDRSLMKKSFSAMLNSETDKQAMQAIQGIINSRKANEKYSFKSGYDVWKLIYNKLPEFRRYFDNPDRIGLKLQRADSDMCLIVCMSFCKQGLPIIPIHDSMVVKDEHGDLLIQEMAKAFRRVVQVQEHWPVFMRVESAYFPDELIVM